MGGGAPLKSNNNNGHSQDPLGEPGEGVSSIQQAVSRVCRVRGGPGGVRHGPHRLLPRPHHLHAPPLPCLRGQGGAGQINIPDSLTFASTFQNHIQ